ncbi:uncharacterized protein FA14DRAFT_158145 [Meira miltonrushii]|uniref:Uncharacterized protein n=1 Tax=Meira miltonrushii TaxID=1280837 RepID=A0A316V7M4_9BASI|nr:uncharacterized protein FA14DRAFT_158145 [Meira miltonrushii]PWN32213.1 hypothetical protein FA14DRAFT_158145 [Meira miltonrushii]
MVRVLLVLLTQLYFTYTISSAPAETTKRLNKEPARLFSLTPAEARSHQREEEDLYHKIAQPLDKHEWGLIHKSVLNPTRIYDRFKVKSIQNQGRLHQDNMIKLSAIAHTGGKALVSKSASGKRWEYRSTHPDQNTGNPE